MLSPAAALRSDLARSLSLPRVRLAIRAVGTKAREHKHKDWEISCPSQSSCRLHTTEAAGNGCCRFNDCSCHPTAHKETDFVRPQPGHMTKAGGWVAFGKSPVADAVLAPFALGWAGAERSVASESIKSTNTVPVPSLRVQSKHKQLLQKRGADIAAELRVTTEKNTIPHQDGTGVMVVLCTRPLCAAYYVQVKKINSRRCENHRRVASIVLRTDRRDWSRTASIFQTDIGAHGSSRSWTLPWSSRHPVLSPDIQPNTRHPTPAPSAVCIKMNPK